MKEHNEDGRNGVRRRVCWPPETVSAVAGPEGWECGLRWSQSSPPLLSGAACSSSWLWPCYSHRSQSIFAARNNNVHYLQLMSSILKFLSETYPFMESFSKKIWPPRLGPEMRVSGLQFDLLSLFWTYNRVLHLLQQMRDHENHFKTQIKPQEADCIL